MDSFGLPDGSHGMKGKAAIRHIQNEAAVFRTHTDVGDLHEFRSWGLTTVGRCVEGFGHVHRQLYFRLGLRITFLFFAATRMHPLQGRVQHEPPCSLLCRKPETSKAKIIELPEKYIGGIRRTRPLQAAAGHEMVGQEVRDVECSLLWNSNGNCDSHEARNTYFRQRADAGDHGTRD